MQRSQQIYMTFQVDMENIQAVILEMIEEVIPEIISYE